MGKGSMRAAMPGITAWLDDLRRVFGEDEFNEQIRKGLRGECVFYVAENGHEMGKPGPRGVPVSVRPPRKG